MKGISVNHTCGAEVSLCNA